MTIKISLSGGGMPRTLEPPVPASAPSPTLDTTDIIEKGRSDAPTLRRSALGRSTADSGENEPPSPPPSKPSFPSTRPRFAAGLLRGAALCAALLFAGPAVAQENNPALSDVKANPASIEPGESSTLSWSPRADVENVLISGGELTEEPATGTSHVVMPSETTTYELVAMGEGAELGTFELIVTVKPALSDVLANPATIKLGESSTLQWTPRADVEKVLISGGELTEEPATGTSHVVMPSETTTYELVAMGEGAELGTFELTVTVRPDWADDPALTDVTANPASIEPGESSTLSWSPRADVENVLISGGELTEEPATGTSHDVMPSETTTYELVAMGEGAELGTFELIVTVKPALSDVLANPATIKLGESSTLQWTPRADVEKVLISGGELTEEPATGTSHVVMPSETTTYELVAMGEGAELGTFELTVTVRPDWADDPALTDVTANPASIEPGESSTLSWSPRADVENVLISGGELTEEPATGTSHVVMPSETTTYELVAMGEGAELGTFELTVTVRPDWADDPALTDVTANPASIEPGESSTLSWSPRADVENVLISGGELTEEPATGTSHVVMPSETTTYELVAMGEGAELGTFELIVTVKPALSDVLANPATIKLGESSTLQWTPRADVEKVLISGGELTEEPATGTSHVVMPSETTTYELVAMGEGAELGTFELTVTVRPDWADDPALTDVTANPASIEPGESSTLSWSPRADVENVLISGGELTEEPATGTSHVVMPSETTTYELVAMGEGAELGTFELTVTVRPDWADDPALTDVTANPASIEPGESSTLSWSPRADVENVLISGGELTEEPATGTSHVVMPSETTTYELVAMGEGAELGTFELTVTVRPDWADDPALTDVTANPASIEPGESSTLSWSPRADVENVLISGGELTEEPATGTSHVVMPSETTTYELVAMGEGAELGTFELIVTVKPALSDVLANPAMIKLGESSTLEWTSREDIVRVLVTLPDGTTADVEPLEGQYVVTPSETGTFTYTLAPENEEGSPLPTYDLTVTVNPTWFGDPALSDVLANPATIKLGESSTLEWTSREDVANVVVTRPDGTMADVEPLEGQYVVTPSETGTFTYTLAPENEEGSPLPTYDLTVTVNPTWFGDPALSDVLANPATIKLGESSTLEWTSREDIVRVLVTLPDGTTADVEPLEGQYVVTPSETGTFTYTLAPENEEGSPLPTYDLTVTVNPTWFGDPALSDVLANPAMIKLGESSTLEWTSREDIVRVLVTLPDGTTADVEPLEGQYVVTPSETGTFTYTLAPENEEGSPLPTYDLTVTVNPTWFGDPALSDVLANPATIKLGESSTLEWTSREDIVRVLVTLPDGTTADVEPLEGQYVVTPSETGTFTYTLAPENEEGSPLPTYDLTVTVNPTWFGDPALSDVLANPATIKLGESSTLEWTSREDIVRVLVTLPDGTTADVEPLEGQYVVTPSETGTFTYTLAPENEEGSPLPTYDLTVTVNPTWFGDPALSDVLANPAMIKLGESSTLEWTSREDIVRVLVTLPDGTTADVEPLEGQYVVTPSETGTFTYTLAPENEEGSPLPTYDLTVTVNPTWFGDPALSDVLANPATIKLGESSTLEWTSREDIVRVLVTLPDGTTADVEPLEGRYVVTPSETGTFTYTLAPENEEGSPLPTYDLTVTVNPTWFGDPALSDVLANPATIKLGESSTLEWTSREDIVRVLVTLPDGTTADVEPLEGHYVVTPSETGTFTYTLAPENEEGSPLPTYDLTVTVNPTWFGDPALSDVLANPATIKLGESSTLEWTSREDIVRVLVTLPDGTTADVEPLEGHYVVTPVRDRHLHLHAGARERRRLPAADLRPHRDRQPDLVWRPGAVRREGEPGDDQAGREFDAGMDVARGHSACARDAARRDDGGRRAAGRPLRGHPVRDRHLHLHAGARERRRLPAADLRPHRDRQPDLVWRPGAVRRAGEPGDDQAGREFDAGMDVARGHSACARDAARRDDGGRRAAGRPLRGHPVRDRHLHLHAGARERRDRAGARERRRPRCRPTTSP